MRGMCTKNRLNNLGLRYYDVVMKIPKAARKYFELTGSMGGHKAAANMTKEQRIERARKAVAAREAKRKRQRQ